MAGSPLRVGQPVYSDRVISFTAIPEMLLGATYLKTANNDKGSVGDNFLSFDIDRRATLFVGYDVRIAEIPLWLRSFTELEETISSSDTDFRVFTKDVFAGTVTLGGNASADLNSMYTVIIK